MFTVMFFIVSCTMRLWVHAVYGSKEHCRIEAQPRSYSAPLSHSHTRRSRGDYGKMANEGRQIALELGRKLAFGTYRGPSGPRYVPNWIRAMSQMLFSYQAPVLFVSPRFAIAHRLLVPKVAECYLRFRLLQCNISPFFPCRHVTILVRNWTILLQAQEKKIFSKIQKQYLQYLYYRHTG